MHLLFVEILTYPFIYLSIYLFISLFNLFMCLFMYLFPYDHLHHFNHTFSSPPPSPPQEELGGSPTSCRKLISNFQWSNIGKLSFEVSTHTDDWLGAAVLPGELLKDSKTPQKFFISINLLPWKFQFKSENSPEPNWNSPSLAWNPRILGGNLHTWQHCWGGHTRCDGKGNGRLVNKILESEL